MRRELVALAGIGAWLLAAVPAHGWVPQVDLRAGEASQHGSLVWQEWTARSGSDSCVSGSADGTGEYPEGLPKGPDAGTRFVLHRSQKPKRVSITAFRSAAPDGSPIGGGEALAFELRARRGADGSITAWRARFATSPPPDYYLDLYVEWPAGVCGGPRHLLRRYHLTAGV